MHEPRPAAPPSLLTCASRVFEAICARVNRRTPSLPPPPSPPGPNGCPTRHGLIRGHSAPPPLARSQPVVAVVYAKSGRCVCVCVCGSVALDRAVRKLSRAAFFLKTKRSPWFASGESTSADTFLAVLVSCLPPIECDSSHCMQMGNYF